MFLWLVIRLMLTKKRARTPWPGGAGPEVPVTCDIDGGAGEKEQKEVRCLSFLSSPLSRSDFGTRGEDGRMDRDGGERERAERLRRLRDLRSRTPPLVAREADRGGRGRRRSSKNAPEPPPCLQSTAALLRENAAILRLFAASYACVCRWVGG